MAPRKERISSLEKDIANTSAAIRMEGLEDNHEDNNNGLKTTKGGNDTKARDDNSNGADLEEDRSDSNGSKEGKKGGKENEGEKATAWRAPKDKGTTKADGSKKGATFSADTRDSTGKIGKKYVKRSWGDGEEGGSPI